MSVHDPAHVRVFRRVSDLDAPVNDDVVEDEIKRAVDQYANADPEQKPQTLHPQTNGNGHDGDETKDNGEVVILLEEAFVVIVVVLMPVPHHAVHDVFVNKPCRSFHEQNSGPND